jgi:hypothetical protein
LAYRHLLWNGLPRHRSRLDFAYSEGRCDVVEKNSRRAIVRYGGASSAFRTSLINNFPSGLLFLLELNGAKNVDVRISRDEIVDDKLVLEVTVLFNP